MCVNEIAAALFSLPPLLSFSVDAYVRDLACYVSWSFARAYDPVVITPCVSMRLLQLYLVYLLFSISLCVCRCPCEGLSLLCQLVLCWGIWPCGHHPICVNEIAAAPLSLPGIDISLTLFLSPSFSLSLSLSLFLSCSLSPFLFFPLSPYLTLFFLYALLGISLLYVSCISG